MFGILCAAMLSQFPVVAGAGFQTPRPWFDPVRYQIGVMGLGGVVGPIAPPVGNPRIINLRPTGIVKSIDPAKKLFTVSYPGYETTYHYGPGTRFYGKLETGRVVNVDASSYTVSIQ